MCASPSGAMVACWSICLKQAFRIVALDRCGNHSRSKRSRSNVPPKYADPRRFFARLASEIFLISLQTAFFNNLLDHFQRNEQQYIIMDVLIRNFFPCQRRREYVQS